MSDDDSDDGVFWEPPADSAIGQAKECRTKWVPRDDKPSKVRFRHLFQRRVEQCHHMHVPKDHPPIKEEFYTDEYAPVLARYIMEIREGATVHGSSFAQNHILQKGLRKFGKSGEAAASAELDQLHSWHCFTPVAVSELSAEERHKALPTLMFLMEKREKSIKGRFVANGKPSREWLRR